MLRLQHAFLILLLAAVAGVSAGCTLGAAESGDVRVWRGSLLKDDALPYLDYQRNTDGSASVKVKGATSTTNADAVKALAEKLPTP